MSLGEIHFSDLRTMLDSRRDFTELRKTLSGQMRTKTDSANCRVVFTLSDDFDLFNL